MTNDAVSAGGTSFFTVHLADRNLRLLVEHVAVLREVTGTTH
jgi:hypothetical protein